MVVGFGWAGPQLEPPTPLDAAACFDGLVAEEARADAPVAADLAAHRLVDLERQPQPRLGRAAVAVRAPVGAGEERRHRVGVRVVQLDAVEAGLARAASRLREQVGQHARQFFDVGEVHVVDLFAVPPRVVAELAAG